MHLFSVTHNQEVHFGPGRQFSLDITGSIFAFSAKFYFTSMVTPQPSRTPIKFTSCTVTSKSILSQSRCAVTWFAV